MATFADHSGSAHGPYQGECTLILRGIACRLTREDVKQILDEAGLRGKFSFIYAPRIVARKSNLGYAFVRFRALEYAQECHHLCHGRPFGPAARHKVCDVSFAKNQGDASAILQLSRRRQDGQDPGLLFCSDAILQPAGRRSHAAWGAPGGSRAPPGPEALPPPWCPQGAAVSPVAGEMFAPKAFEGQRCGPGRVQVSPSTSSKPRAFEAPAPRAQAFVAELSSSGADLFEDGEVEALDGSGAPGAPFGVRQVLSF